MLQPSVAAGVATQVQQGAVQQVIYPPCVAVGLQQSQKQNVSAHGETYGVHPAAYMYAHQEFGDTPILPPPKTKKTIVNSRTVRVHTSCRDSQQSTLDRNTSNDAEVSPTIELLGGVHHRRLRLQRLQKAHKPGQAAAAVIAAAQ